MKTHYVYKITDPKTKQFYFGSRTCEGQPENDDYMGSMVTWSPENKDRLQKKIIKSDFKTRDNAIAYEAYLIKKYIDNKLNENYYIPNKGFHTTDVNVYDIWAERYGKEKATKMWNERNTQIGNFSKGKTYEELYGDDIASRMKENRSKRVAGNKNPAKRREVRNKISKTRIERKVASGKNNPMYGSNRTGSLNPKAKEVKCNCHSKEFGSIKECALYHNINYSTFCHNLRNGNYKSQYIVNK